MLCAKHLFHRPHLFNQGLLLLPAGRPDGQENFQSKQDKEKEAHFQAWKWIRYALTGEGLPAGLPAHHDRHREPGQQGSQGSKDHIAKALTNIFQKSDALRQSPVYMGEGAYRRGDSCGG